MDEAKNITKIVPQIYFDLIARIPPGLIVLVAIFRGGGIDAATVESVGAVAALVYSVFFAYGLGLMLDVAGDLVAAAIKRIAGLPSDLVTWSNIDRLKDRALASVLTKVMAEKALARSLFLLSCASLVPAVDQFLNLAPWLRVAVTIICLATTLRLEFHAYRRSNDALLAAT